MEEILTLFNMEKQNEFEVGKQLYEMSIKNPNSSISSLMKKMNLDNDALGRRAYWSYIVLEVCELRQRLRNNKKEYLLNGIKNYIFVNYSKLIKTKIGTIDKINDELKDYIYEFFLDTFEQSERDLRKRIENEIKLLHSEEINSKQMDIYDGEKEGLKSQIRCLNEYVNDLKKENEDLTLKIESIEGFISEFGHNIKRDITQINKYYLMCTTILIFILTVIK